MEIVIKKFLLVEFTLCTTQLVQISHNTIFFQVPKIVLSGDRGDPLYLEVNLLDWNVNELENEEKV